MQGFTLLIGTVRMPDLGPIQMSVMLVETRTSISLELVVLSEVGFEERNQFTF